MSDRSHLRYWILKNFFISIFGITTFLPSECSCSSLKIEAVTPPIQHAEGSHWDKEKQVLYYVDTFHPTVYRYDPNQKINKITKQKIDGRDSIGIVVPVKGHDNVFLVAADRYLYKLQWNSNENNTGTLTEIQMVDEHKPKNQFNDGKADAKGRMWIGTLTREPDGSVAPHGGSLYRFDSGGNYSEMIAKTSISNGLAWSKDNTKFFYCDSQSKNIQRYEYDLETGKLGERRTLFDLKDHPNLQGIPDGLTIDENDNLWIALFGGHGIVHVDGKTGHLIRFLKLSTQYCTSATFGGPSQDILFVTTSRKVLSEEENKQQPEAGVVFAIRGLGVKGPAPHECVLK